MRAAITPAPRGSTYALALSLLFLSGLAAGALADHETMTALVHPRLQAPLYRIPTLTDTCGKRSVMATNSGTKQTVATMIFWGNDTSKGPLKAECSAELEPGDTWSFDAAHYPPSTRSAVMISLSTSLLSELPAPGALPPDIPVSSYICEQLFFTIVRQQNEYLRFEDAWITGTEWQGVPLDEAYGSALTADATAPTCAVYLPVTIERR